jgi:hypothetical protein
VLGKAEASLRAIAGRSARAEELLGDADQLAGHFAVLASRTFDAVHRKRMTNESWRRQRGRR